MSNQEMGLSNGPVELGAPVLTINPPAQPEAKPAEQAQQETESNVEGNQDKREG